MKEIDDDILAQRLIQCLEKHVGLADAGKIARDLIRYIKPWGMICDRPYIPNIEPVTDGSWFKGDITKLQEWADKQ